MGEIVWHILKLSENFLPYLHGQVHSNIVRRKKIFPDFDSLKIPFFLHPDNQRVVKKTLIFQGESHLLFVPLKEASCIGVNK